MHELTNDQCHENCRPGGENGTRRINECARDHDPKYRVDHQQDQEDNDHEQSTRSFPDDFF